MSVTGLDHIQLAMPKGRETDVRAFYEGLLGISEVAKPGALVQRGGCWFECGALKVHLGVEDDFRPARKAHPAFFVTDLDAMTTALARAGLRVTSDESLDGCARVHTADPFGNRIELIQAFSSFVRRPPSP